MRWIDIPEPDPEYVNDDDPRGTFNQGRRLGATLFNRLEGCWYDEDDGSTYFVSTSGGDVKNGDVNSPTATARASARSGSTGRTGAPAAC